MGVALWPVRGVLLGLTGAELYFFSHSAWLVLLLWAAAALALREPRVGGASGIVVLLLCLGVSSQLFPAAGSVHWAEILIASQTLPRAAMAVLVWIARPAVNFASQDIKSAGVIIAIAVGMLTAFLAGWPAILLLAASLLVVRVVLGWSYQRLGGINRSSLGWVRQVLEVVILAIAHLPISFLYSAAR